MKAQAPEEEPRPFTLTSTSSGMQIQPPEAFSAETPVTAEDGHSPEAMAVKLTAAQQKIDAGFPDDAEKLLREVKLFGTSREPPQSAFLTPCAAFKPDAGTLSLRAGGGFPHGARY